MVRLLTFLNFAEEHLASIVEQYTRLQKKSVPFTCGSMLHWHSSLGRISPSGIGLHDKAA